MAPGCDLGTVTSCASCEDDCTRQILHADAHCVASTGSHQCRYFSCEPGFEDTDGDSANGCESACALSETCDEKDNDCDHLVDNMDTAAVQADCGGQWPGAADVDAWACSQGQCRPAICVAGMVDTNGYPADGCEETCVAGGSETCDHLDNDCDGIVDNEGAVGCATFGPVPDSTADNRCLCTPVAPYLYPLTISCGDGSCEAPEDCGGCPADCGECSYCGDGVCNGANTSANCPLDCSSSCGDGACSGDETTAICPDDCGSGCGDLACNGAESTTRCPQDCGSSCGDGACNGGESTATCAQDCGSTCGDGACNGSETSVNCPEDCGANCGDGACNRSENAANCPADCSPSWRNRKKITFDNKASTENLVDFPVLVTLDASNIDFAKIKAGGADIRFVDDDGTALAYEIQSWDDGGETATVWVKVQQINLGVSTDYIHIYYNNTSASDAQNTTGVWDATYAAVWHLEESGSGSADEYRDSTSNNNHGLGGGGVAGMTPAQDTAGKINNAQAFDTAADDHVEIADSASVGISADITIEALIKRNGTGGCNAILATSQWWDYAFYVERDKLRFWSDSTTPDHLDSKAKIADTSWHHVAVTRIGSTVTFYIDGTAAAGGGGTMSGAFDDHAAPVRIGYTGERNSTFNGSIDELRLSNTGRSADWIEAQYKSQYGSFNTFGSEQSGDWPL